MNLIAVAKETIKITNEKQYKVDDIVVNLPEVDYEDVQVYSPKDGEELLAWDMSPKFTQKMCAITCTAEDSFQAGRRFENALVMNFANAHNPGGAFLLGSKSQEEALCRCSTLYKSITSVKAKEMYRYNNTHISNVESDYMLLSPTVCVFRDEKCNFLDTPVMTSVITVPAPNLYGAAITASHKKVEETMIRRIRIMLRIAAKSGYRNLILGAWGCGAFGNNPKHVAGYFKSVLIDESYGKCFDNVCFAIYGNSEGKNIRAFKEAILG